MRPCPGGGTRQARPGGEGIWDLPDDQRRVAYKEGLSGNTRVKTWDATARWLSWGTPGHWPPSQQLPKALKPPTDSDRSHAHLQEGAGVSPAGWPPSCFLCGVRVWLCVFWLPGGGEARGGPGRERNTWPFQQ